MEAISKPRIAVVGCGHGGLDTIYSDLETNCLAKGWTLADLDVLIICGDFQAVRNESDLNCMSVPWKYRQLGDFHKYYSQQTRAPVLTIVIGGNHEASNYFFELYHGGWLAPNIYYLGAAGVIRYGPWRIAGISGIYSRGDYRIPHHERLPYDRDGIKSIYHVRQHDVDKLLRVTDLVDIGLSHDWPAWVELFGDYAGLYASRPHFLDSAKKDNLGSKPATRLLDHLRPKYWFSGHMHVKFSANVKHSETSMEDTIRLRPMAERLRATLPIFKQKPTHSSDSGSAATKEASETQFLALSKVGHHASTYMELLELELPASTDGAQFPRRENNKYDLYYDEEWLAITRSFNDTLRLADPNTLIVPPLSTLPKPVSDKAIAKNRTWVRENITDKGLLKIPANFSAHAPVHAADVAGQREQPPEYPNQQTADFAALLEMNNNFAITEDAQNEEDDLFDESLLN